MEKTCLTEFGIISVMGKLKEESSGDRFGRNRERCESKHFCRNEQGRLQEGGKR